MNEGQPEDVSFVLVYDLDADSNNIVNKRKRRTFESNLIKNGVNLSKVDGITDQSLCFVKMNLPWDTLVIYADIMKMKMPLKKSEIKPPESTYDSIVAYLPSIFHLPASPLFEETEEHLSVFRKDKIGMFNIISNETFFSNAKKGLIANEILNRTAWGTSSLEIGVQRLINTGVYLAAYPLHEGKYKSTTTNINELTQRQVLYEYWAKLSRFYYYQPIPLIRKYFGERIAIYFFWLGFYTLCLIPAAILGTFGFLYSIVQFGKDEISVQVCNDNVSGSLVMCPLCNEVCDYWNLRQSCLFLKIAYVFDNDFTIVFAIFMSLWGSIFLHFWGRKDSELQFIWNTKDYEEEESMRQEYETACTKFRINPVTNEVECYMPFKERFPRLLLSFMSVVLMVFMVVGIVIGGILIRMVLARAFLNAKLPFITSYINLFTSLVAAFFNLMAIVILDTIYHAVAIWMTDFENPRTETEYDDSFTLKMYSFQFLNFYSTLFYISFFKGTFVGRPGNYKLTFGWRQEECDPAGCMVELCIQMLVVFIGKQLISNIFEYSKPFFKSKFFIKLYQFKHRKMKNVTRRRRRHYNNFSTDTTTSNPPTAIRGDAAIHLSQWERDFHLVDSTSVDLFDEYLEMVIQFGFVTLFAAAMPLAPFFALLNNIFEIRMDAYKMLTRVRRPVAREAQDIGVWYYILRVIAILAVSTNGFIICFTSNAVPRMVYRFYYNRKTFGLNGYINFTLSYFNVTDFQDHGFPVHVTEQYRNVSVCRYRDFRNGPYNLHPYELSSAFWRVLAARLAFVIIFEHVVFFISLVIYWVVPETPSAVKIRVQQEKMLNIKLLYQTGTSEFFRQRSEDKELNNSDRKKPKKSRKKDSDGDDLVEHVV